jgi:hypothetical protein
MILLSIGALINDTESAVLEGYIERRRPVGRPRGRWLDAVAKDAKRSAEDRDGWWWRIE